LTFVQKKQKYEFMKALRYTGEYLSSPSETGVTNVLFWQTYNIWPSVAVIHLGVSKEKNAVFEVGSILERDYQFKSISVSLPDPHDDASYNLVLQHRKLPWIASVNSSSVSR
jgi:hypothetical protein